MCIAIRYNAVMRSDTLNDQKITTKLKQGFGPLRKLPRALYEYGYSKAWSPLTSFMVHVKLLDIYSKAREMDAHINHNPKQTPQLGNTPCHPYSL